MTAKNDYHNLIEKLHEQTVFLINQFDSIAVKSVPAKGYFIKFKGEKEVFVQKSNSVILDLIVEYREITEEEYNKF